MSRVPDRSPLTPAATSVPNHLPQGYGSASFVVPFPPSRHSSREDSRYPSTSLRLPAQISPGNRLQVLTRGVSQAQPLVIHQAQSRQAIQARLRHNSPNSDLGRLFPETAPEAKRLSPLPSPSLENNVIFASPIFEQHNLGHSLLVPGYPLSPSTRLFQNPRHFQSKIAPSVESGQVSHFLPGDGVVSASGLQHPEHVLIGRRFVPYGDTDPGKHAKKKDDIQDKQRKEDLSLWNGACFGCREAKKQCQGKEVCDRCRKLTLLCIRACDSCLSDKKLLCDDGICCKNCQRSATNCCRPSVTSVALGQVPPAVNLPPPPPSKQVKHGQSSTHVNNHPFWETRSAIDAPTAWHVGFGIPTGPQRRGKHCRSGSVKRNFLTVPPLRVPADVTSNESAADVNSDIALVGSQPYSQQATDVELPGTFTMGSTITYSDVDAPNVANKRETDLESSSGVTELSYFEEATYHQTQNYHT